MSSPSDLLQKFSNQDGRLSILLSSQNVNDIPWQTRRKVKQRVNMKYRYYKTYLDSEIICTGIKDIG